MKIVGQQVIRNTIQRHTPCTNRLTWCDRSLFVDKRELHVVVHVISRNKSKIQLDGCDNVLNKALELEASYFPAEGFFAGAWTILTGASATDIIWKENLVS